MQNRKLIMDSWESLDRIFNNFTQDLSHHEDDLYPKVHTHRSDDELRLDFVLPGVDPKKVDLKYKEGTLTLKGVRASLSPKESFLRRERPQGSFERTLVLPFKVDEENVIAQYKNGILTVNLVKEKTQSAKKITIQTQGAA